MKIIKKLLLGLSLLLLLSYLYFQYRENIPISIKKYRPILSNLLWKLDPYHEIRNTLFGDSQKNTIQLDSVIKTNNSKNESTAYLQTFDSFSLLKSLYNLPLPETFREIIQEVLYERISQGIKSGILVDVDRDRYWGWETHTLLKYSLKKRKSLTTKKVITQPTKHFSQFTRATTLSIHIQPLGQIYLNLEIFPSLQNRGIYSLAY
jgi:hypothetical protein